LRNANIRHLEKATRLSSAMVIHNVEISITI